MPFEIEMVGITQTAKVAAATIKGKKIKAVAFAHPGVYDQSC